MDKRKKKVLTYIALGFMAVFTVSLIMFYINPNMWNGGVAFIALFSGVCGIGLHFYIKQLSKKDTSYLPEEKIDNDNIDENIEGGIEKYESIQSEYEPVQDNVAAAQTTAKNDAETETKN